jgi:phage baseplate assembly protein W
MRGYSPKLPLNYDFEEDGVYSLNKTLRGTIQQNLKMLILTNPGEYIMDSNFGVGIKRFIFEQDSRDVRDNLQKRIISQVSRYLSFITIEEINISPPNSNEENAIFIKIIYSVPSLNINDELNIDS